MAAELSWWWWPMSPWLSRGPAWFVFFSVVVGAVAVLSRRQGGAGQAATGRRRLTRRASSMLLERLRSLSVFSFHPAADYGSSVAAPLTQHHHYQTHQVRQEVEEWQMSTAAPEPASAMGERRTARMAPPPHSAHVAPAQDFATSMSRNGVPEAEKSVSLDEAHRLAERGPARRLLAAAAEETRPRKVAKVTRRHCRLEADAAEGEEEVNARAELFIRQFREELKLQRLNSIINYTNSLHHGAGAVPPR